MFNTSAFDLDAYLHRLRHDAPVRPDLDTLRALALEHPLAIPFENLNPLLRLPVPLDIASLQQKMVREERGGWCFEQNLLFGHALASIGFRITGLAARVMWNATAPVPPRSHMVLLVDVGGDAHIADAGFGGLTLTAPLRLQAGGAQTTPHEPFRIAPYEDEYAVEALVGGKWKALYRFDLQRQTLADYEVTNWYLSHHPGSHFLNSLMTARVERDRRYALRNTELSIHHQDGRTERRVLDTAAAVRAALGRDLRIRVPDPAAFDERVAQLCGFVPSQK